MANPVIVNCPKNEWTSVATNVQSGFVRRLSTKPNVYLQTYRLTGEQPPTELNEGTELFAVDPSEAISADAAIDVYVAPINVNGQVRVDL